eukprot:CAMPEP_0113892806 /NCGR_PEP_ID=MMETSP0780_2-20120614/15657_1 /TAXON_ID=652834 /ORGANISM="Palpitomonas bilix" /LENGTH=334 /DNA_ID=CAMNT_0000882857 /DNA_START=869 /DNA_END=1869 /DNA_ORIENTATION=+ /assembly_acc=CAM_ASM_000599
MMSTSKKVKKVVVLKEKWDKVVAELSLLRQSKDSFDGNMQKMQLYLNSVLKINKDAKEALVEKFATRERHAVMFEHFFALKVMQQKRRDKEKQAEKWRKRRLAECVFLHWREAVSAGKDRGVMEKWKGELEQLRGELSELKASAQSLPSTFTPFQEEVEVVARVEREKKGKDRRKQGESTAKLRSLLTPLKSEVGELRSGLAQISEEVKEAFDMTERGFLSLYVHAKDSGFDLPRLSEKKVADEEINDLLQKENAYLRTTVDNLKKLLRDHDRLKYELEKRKEEKEEMEKEGEDEKARHEVKVKKLEKEIARLQLYENEVKKWKSRYSSNIGGG